MKSRWKRLLASVLAASMLLSMVQIAGFANNEETSGKVEHNNTEWTEATDADGNPVGVAHKKTIEKVGENTFEITLEVKTKEEITRQVASPDAAVVIVMDVSNSMAEDVNGNEAKKEADQRITKAKAAAKKFIEDFAKDAGGAQRQVALVEFGSNAMTVQSWTDANTAKNAVDNIAINFGTPACTIQGTHTHDENTIEWGGVFHNRWRCSVETCKYYVKDPGFLWMSWHHAWTNTDYEGHTHEKTYDGPHGKLTKDGGGTNIEAGLQLADNLLKAYPASEAKKYVVLITDGVPTYHVYQEHYEQGNTSFIEGQKGGGNKATKPDYEPVPVVANSIKGKGPLYTVSYAASGKVGDQNIDAWLASFATKNVSAGDNIDWGLGNISEIIKNQAQAWILTDPIPAPYIVYKPEDNNNIPDAATNPNSVLNYKSDDNGTTLTWDLKSDTAKTSTEGDVTWYSYKTSYTIHLDTAAKGFVEDKVYPTNDTTTLTYMLTKDGELQPDLKSTDLDVPAVSGKIPTVGWTIEYYKQENATKGAYANYTKVETDTKTGKDKVGTQINLTGENGKDQNYETKYAVQNYEKVYVVGDGLKVELNPTQDPTKNVIKVYYDRKTTSAVVNYHYTLTVIDENGSTTTEYDVPNAHKTDGLFVGDRYEVAYPQTSPYGGYTYSFDHAAPNGAAIEELKENGEENVIDLYYVKEIDYRKDAGVVVDHVYTLHTYELVDGKYVTKNIVTEIPNVESETGLKAGMTYTASTTPRVGFGSYQYKGFAGIDNVKTLTEGENKITLNFENWKDPRGEELSLTVKHHYTKSVTEIVDGEVVTTKNPDDAVVEETITFYAGETVTIGENKSYNSETYNSDAGNAAKIGRKVTTSADKNAVIDLYYTLTEVPEKTTVTVKHIYQTVTKKTVSVYAIDPDTGIWETDTEVEEIIVTDKEETDDPIDLYVGESYTAEPRTPGNGYEYVEDAEESTALTVAAPGEIVIVYQRKAEEKPENENDAWIRETHIYYTDLRTIVGGAVKTIRVYDGGETIDYVGKVGDEYAANEKLTFNGNNYDLISGADTTETLTKGDNGTIEFVYKREASDLTDTRYTVKYQYYTRTMTVVDGVAVWGETVLDTETSTSGTGYVGQKVTLDTGAMDGYTAYGSNPSATQFLKNGSNEWTFQYVKDVPLAQVNVTVNHHITTRTLTIDGETSFTQDLMGRPEYKYEGEAYEAKALELGENATLTLVNVNGNDVDTTETVTFDALTGTVVVDFYYEIVNDYRISASYTVQHIYRTINWDGTVTVDSPKAVTASPYAGEPRTASISIPENSGYVLTEATYNGSNVKDRLSEGAYNFTVLAGDNNVVFIYERTVDTRADVTLTLTYDANGGSNAPGADSQTVKEGESATFTVKGQESMTRSGYTFQGWATSADGAVAYRAADSITISENTTLYAVWSLNTTPNPDPDPDPIYYYTLTINYVDESGNVVATQYTSGRQVSGWNYSVTSPEVEGMTPDQETVSGILTRNTTITVVYTAVEDVEETQTPTTETPEPTESTEPTETPEPVEPQEPEETEELEENNTPLTEMPDVTEESEDLEENETPLAEVPQTGDSLGLWIMLALCSAAGLAWIALTEKKGKRVA